MTRHPNPHRNDTAIQLGKQMGVTFTIDTDSGFNLLRHGADEVR